jgi:hypothetical protein
MKQLPQLLIIGSNRISLDLRCNQFFGWQELPAGALLLSVGYGDFSDTCCR